MKKYIFSALAVIAAIALILTFTSSPMAKGEVEIDKPAIDFTLTDTNGNQVSLSDYRGKWVVLEWINYDCPFVKKHYDSGNMQSLQKKYTDKDVVWLAICSNKPESQGNFPVEEIHRRWKAHGSTLTAYLLDEDGKVGRIYGATNTPHMYIVDPEGALVYMGAIDSIPSASKSDIEKSDNYVTMALDAVLAGKDVPVKTTKAYGCSVKY